MHEESKYPDVKKCEGCLQLIPNEQFVGTLSVATVICNNCLYRLRLSNDLLAKFILWSRTCKNFKSISNIGSIFISNYSAPEIERFVVSALVNKENRKDLVSKLLSVTGDAGDQLLLAECMEELNKIQDEHV